ncbi:MAG: ABC transporter ATP-binding protein [Dehalococcoidia bacterium]
MTRGPSAAVPAIRAEHLSKQYAGGVRALDDVSMEVPRGAVFGLLGPNGAGKTTLIRILLDMIRPTGGRAHILEWDTQRQGVEARRHIGYLQGTPHFYKDMDAAALFDFVAEIRGVQPDVEYVHELVDRLQVAAHRPVRTLSRGNQQKVAMVAALLTRPEVVILDEPTTGLDPLIQEQVLEIVREVAAEGRTVFFSSHILHEVEHVCDHVGVLRGGRLVGVFDLAAQRRLASRTVAVTFDRPVPPERFADLEGVTLASASGATLTFNVAAGIGELVKRLAEHTVVSLDSHEPTLEDFFFSLYEQDSDAEAVR